MISNLRRFVCDECDTEIIAESQPDGWIYLSSTGGSGSSVGHPVLIRLTRGRDLKVDRKNIWCRVECLSAWLLARLGERRPAT